jgi:hypothetical protein
MVEPSPTGHRQLSAAPSPEARRARRRAGVAFIAAAGTVAGTCAVALAVIAGAAPTLSGYVSEAGVFGDYARVYRAGIFLVAGALLGCATVLPPGLRPAVTLLVVGAAGTTVSGAVKCSAGCPLPPFEPTTPADLVHGGASIVGAGAAVLSMVVLALSTATPRPVRTSARVGAAVSLPLAAVMIAALLTVGRSTFSGIVERVLLLAVAVWLTATTLGLGRVALRAAGGLVAVGNRADTRRWPFTRRR